MLHVSKFFYLFLNILCKTFKYHNLSNNVKMNSSCHSSALHFRTDIILFRYSKYIEKSLCSLKYVRYRGAQPPRICQTLSKGPPSQFFCTFMKFAPMQRISSQPRGLHPSATPGLVRLCAQLACFKHNFCFCMLYSSKGIILMNIILSFPIFATLS